MFMSMPETSLATTVAAFTAVNASATPKNKKESGVHTQKSNKKKPHLIVLQRGFFLGRVLKTKESFV